MTDTSKSTGREMQTNNAKHTSAHGVYVNLSDLLALRAQADRLQFTAPHRSRAMLPGDVKSRECGRGIEFEEVRRYQSGDDIRSIDWRVTARMGKPYTRLYNEEREHKVFFALDQRPNMFFGTGDTFKSVAGARLAALMSWSSLICGDRVSGLVASDTLTSVRNGSPRQAVLQLLNAMAEANTALSSRSQSAVTLPDILHRCLAHSAAGSTVVIISDFNAADHHFAQALAALARKRLPILLRIIDPLESALPRLGTVGISDGRSASRLHVSQAQQDHYHAQRDRADRQLHKSIAHCSATLVSTTTEDDPIDVLHRSAWRSMRRKT